MARLAAGAHVGEGPSADTQAGGCKGKEPSLQTDRWTGRQGRQEGGGNAQVAGAGVRSMNGTPENTSVKPSDNLPEKKRFTYWEADEEYVKVQ